VRRMWWRRSSGSWGELVVTEKLNGRNLRQTEKRCAKRWGGKATKRTARLIGRRGRGTEDAVHGDGRPKDNGETESPRKSLPTRKDGKGGGCQKKFLRKEGGGGGKVERKKKKRKLSRCRRGVLTLYERGAGVRHDGGVMNDGITKELRKGKSSMQRGEKRRLPDSLSKVIL